MTRLFFLLLAVGILIFAVTREEDPNERQTGEITVTVDGMFSDGCNLKVKELLMTLDGAQVLEADFVTSKVRLRTTKGLSLNELNSVLSSEDYLATSID